MRTTKFDRTIAYSRLSNLWNTWMVLDDASLLVEVRKLFPSVTGSYSRRVSQVSHHALCGIHRRLVMTTKRGLQTRPPAGTKVRFTGYFLRATGQIAGGEGQKVWTVLAPGECGFGSECLCVPNKGDGEMAWLAVNEEKDPAGYEDVKSTRPDGKLFRHIALCNLQIVGAPPRAADQPEEVGPTKIFERRR